MLLASCGSQKTEEIDISSLQLIPKKEKKISPQVVDKSVEPVSNKLKSLLTNDQLRQNIKVGKNNPFAGLESENNLTLKNIKLTGFLFINNTNYALVNYMGKSGSIMSNSIGGINTDLLPDGAKVKKIDYKNKTLELLFDKQPYEILLD
tara:strand:- start:57 stop:503 length:447 start_codon:yes stop_codon:yes gene_type:complete